MAEHEDLDKAIRLLHKRMAADWAPNPKVHEFRERYGCTSIGIFGLTVILAFLSPISSLWMLGIFLAILLVGFLHVSTLKMVDSRRLGRVRQSSSSEDEARWQLLERLDKVQAFAALTPTVAYIIQPTASVLVEVIDTLSSSRNEFNSAANLHAKIIEAGEDAFVDLLLEAEKAKSPEAQILLSEHADIVHARLSEVLEEARQLSTRTPEAIKAVERTTTSIHSLEERLAELKDLRQAVTELDGDQLNQH